MRQAQRTRAPIQRLADRVAAWFVPAVISNSSSHVCRMGDLGPTPRFAQPAVRERCRRPHHCLPLCPWPCDANGHHGRNRPRRKAPECSSGTRGSRDTEKDRHPVSRQDRHPHRRKPRVVAVGTNTKDDSPDELLSPCCQPGASQRTSLGAAIVAACQGDKNLFASRTLRVSLHRREGDYRKGRREAGCCRKRCASARSRCISSRGDTGVLVPGGGTSILVAINGAYAGNITACGSHQGFNLASSRQPPGARNQYGHGHRRQPGHGRRHCQATWTRRSQSRSLAGAETEIVHQLQQQGKIVAMAGDGINDALRLRKPTSGSRWAPARTSRWKAAT